MTFFLVAACVVAIGLQILATALAQPVRRLVPVRAWMFLIILNFLVLVRRLTTLADVGFGWVGVTHDIVVVVLAMAISVFMLCTVVHLRRYTASERTRAFALASATVALAEKTNTQDSLAFQLATHFVRLREERERLANGHQDESK